LTAAAGDNLIAIESQVLVWGVRKVGPSQQLQRAKWLIDQLEAEDAQIIVPSIVLSEYLCEIPAADHPATIAAFTKRFLVMPFDVLCTSVAAELFEHGKAGRPKGIPGSRKVLRADAMIIATAARHGAKVFYSHDRDCRSLAKKITTWEVRDLPDQPNHLFDYPKPDSATSGPSA
jgi:predicted nucleic acid-binding protein